MIQPRHSRHDFIISLFKKNVLFLFDCALTFTQFPCHIFAEGETARLDVVTWDGTTECGSISLDDGEYGASAGSDYDQSSISLHTVRAKPAYGYYFRGWHVGNSDTAARNSPLSMIENPYSFSFSYNVMSAIIDFLRMHPSETIIITLKSKYDNKTSDGFCR